MRAGKRESDPSPETVLEQANAHRGAMLLTATRILHDSAAAEDVVQDVLLDLWLRPQAFDPARGTLRSYLTLVVRSRAVDRWRSRTARDAALGRAADAAPERTMTGSSAADAVVERDERRVLLTTLACLPREQRDALLLAYGRGLSASGVASAASVPLGTAKSRIRLGLRRTRTLMAATAE